MSIELCRVCKEKPVHIKKRGLCVNCYAKERSKQQPKTTIKDSLIIHRSELDFIRNYFTHNNWSYQPATFNLNTETFKKYTPDFYDSKRNVFIEVIGTRQAFHSNSDKYKLFCELFPKIKIEFRSMLGALIDINTDRIVWPKEVNGNIEVEI